MQVIHTLSPRHPDFDALRGALTEAHARGLWQLVTGTDRHEIIHVTSVPPGLPVPAEPKALEQFAVFLARWRQWLSDRILIPLRLLATVHLPTQVDALQLFNLVSAKSCVPGNWPPDCLPFLYPDHGCRARAHEMCRIILAAGFVPKKVWILPGAGSSGLEVATKHSPACKVTWTNHVAPVLNVVTSPTTVERYVIDPSLFGGPVTLATWEAKVAGTNPYATTILPWHFFLKGGATDDDFSKTNSELTYEREAFLTRIGMRGFPPYC